MAEAYGRGELDTEDDRALIEQVSSRRRVQGRDERIRLQSKSEMRVDDQDLYTIVITTYIPPRQVGDGPWTPWYADYYHPEV